ncbi:MAG: hypothetical protein Q4A59_06380 [Erysipelotrichaceae bacterium]|nr:hypothetical protein [Erysipelotrichaceae bacterium]
MKKILYYFGQAMLILSSLLLFILDSTETMIISYSCIITGILLMLAYAVGTKSKTNWTGFFLFSSISMCHLFYVSLFTPYSGWIMGAFVVMMMVALVFLYFSLKDDIDLRALLSYTLFAKIALIPELIMNQYLAQGPDFAMLGYFNWILLAFTSLFAIRALVKMYQKEIIVQSWAIVLGLFQFFFISDIFSVVAMLTLVIRYKEPEPEVKTPVYKKDTFSSSKVHKPKRNSSH